MATTSTRILIAEDEVALIPLFVRLIQRVYPTALVRTFTDGMSALQAYDQDGADLLIVNYHMPQMDGPTLIRIVRARGDLVPIIATSGDPANGDEELVAGATVFVETENLLREFPALLARFLPDICGREHVE